MNTHKNSKASNNTRTYLKAKALASQLGVSPKTIFRWAESGRISRFKVNARVVLFDVTEIAAMIEQARVGGPQRF